ncbi:hypothetical protein M413DRAFT_378722 [Hebeloma cylindrosporum]|uniref:Uncharacterized protein n=1 Tax=Hebeloma cylindrosporum TaxID=76867 RepID=A0A0C2YTG6_HEBCY|nr:hypothetical protein M413DRAFT_378722 [Hebeloma cylindrosporum h7]
MAASTEYTDPFAPLLITDEDYDPLFWVNRRKANHQGIIQPRPMAVPNLHLIPPLSPTTDPPIASIPPDVLGYILNLVYEKSDSDKNKRPNSPIVFSHVCRFWRSVALDNSLWWSRVIVTPPWKLDEVGTFLSRSKDCPLDLRIFVNISPTTSVPYTYSASLHNYEHFRNLISPHIHRCRIFHLQIYFSTLTDFGVPFFLELFRGVHMPYLEQFVADGRFEIERRLYHRKLFCSAPLLQDLRMGGNGLINYILPLNAVTKLHITAPAEGVSPAQLNAVFNGCTYLTELALYDDILDLTGFPLSPLFAFPSLITLQLLANVGIISEFLILISSAPKLRRLVLVPVYEPDLLLFQEMTTRNKFPSLTSLVLSPLDDYGWKAAIYASTCFPDISHLLFTNSNADPDEFRWCFLERTTPLFPGLLHLALKCVDERLGHAINELVISRHSQNVPLQTVSVNEASLRHLSPYSHLWGDTKLLGADLVGPLGEDLTHPIRNHFLKPVPS